MAIVVIGGHSRNVGKTSVVAGLIAALPACNWTALKISQLGHKGHPAQSEQASATRWIITEEGDSTGKGDTCRFLAAGARRSFLIEADHLVEAMPTVQQMVAESENVIVESNSILEFIHSDLYISVLDPATEDFKASAQKYFDRADAIVLHESGSDEPRLQDVTAKLVAARAVFCIRPPQYVNKDLVKFVAERLKLTASSRV